MFESCLKKRTVIMHCNLAVCLWSEEKCYFGLTKKNAVLMTLLIF